MVFFVSITNLARCLFSSDSADIHSCQLVVCDKIVGIASDCGGRDVVLVALMRAQLTNFVLITVEAEYVAQSAIRSEVGSAKVSWKAQRNLLLESCHKLRVNTRLSLRTFDSKNKQARKQHETFPSTKTASNFCLSKEAKRKRFDRFSTKNLI